MIETTIVAVALLVLAVALAGVGAAGITERLPRNRWVGLRVPAIRDDDASWQVGHRAAGPMIVAAAGPPLLLGVALIAAPPDRLQDWLIVLMVSGLITGGLLALAARSARQALAAPDR
ncbi:MAG: SdpI family protein [Candidatus Limnocylindrales bacterium]